MFRSAGVATLGRMTRTLIRGGQLKTAKIGRRRLLHEPSTRAYFLALAGVAP